MIKAIIYDSDGMLTTDPIFSKTYAAKHNVPLDVMSPFFQGPFRDCLVGKADLKEELQNGWLEKWGWDKSVDELLEYWFSIGSAPNPDILATILELRDEGIICVLATNQEKHRADHLLSMHGYGEIFDTVFASAYVGHKKPSAEFFDEVMKYLESRDATLTKDEVMFWDDDIENVEGAKAYGFQAHQFTDFTQYVKEINALDTSDTLSI